MTKPAIVALEPGARLSDWPPYPAEDIVSGSPAQKGQTWVDDKAHGLWAGFWEAEPNTWRMLDYPVSEFMHIVEGEVEIVEEERVTRFGAGESFVVPKGLRCSWRQLTRVKKIFVIFDDASGPASDQPLSVIRIDPQADLERSEPPPVSVLLSPVPVQHNRIYFKDPTGRFTVGVWDTTGYERKLIEFARHELMLIVEGKVTLGDDRGGQLTFAAGDKFFVPMGNLNSWKSEGYLRKIYVIFQPNS